MADHGSAAVSVVHAPHPDALLVWCVQPCGSYLLFSPPPCFDLQSNIDAWFDMRRELEQDWAEERDAF